MNIFKKITLSIIAVAALVAVSLLAPVSTSAASPKEELCLGAGGTWNGADCTNASDGGRTLEDYFKIIVDVLLYVIGAVSVIMIVIGGVKYVTSGGDSSSVTSAKNTIMYAIIGLVVAILGFALVDFVVDQLARP